MREEEEIYSNYDRWNAPLIKTKEQVLRELATSCSRFTFNAKQVKSDFRSARIAAKFDPFAENSLLLGNGMPANWQLFCRYLYEKKITGEPQAFFYQIRNDLPKFYHCAFASAAKETWTDGRDVNRYGYGGSFDQEESMSKAIGELLERHFLAKYRNSDLLQASYAELKRRRFGPRPVNILELNRFLPFQEAEFPMLKRDEASPIRWVRGFNVVNGEAVYLPARLVFWNYLQKDEMFVGEPNTNGAAGHFTREEAILAGLLEYIQRDGFVIHWLKVRSPRMIDQRTITDPRVLELLADIRRYKLDAYLLDVTTDVGIPSCLCVLLDRRSDAYIIHMGAGAGFSQEEIFIPAIKEAIALRNTKFEDDSTIVLGDSYRPFLDVEMGPTERLRVWRGKAMFEKFAPFLEGPLVTVDSFMKGVESNHTTVERLTYIQERLAKLGKGYEIFAYEVQDPVLTTIGYHVVKLLVPRLVHLYLREQDAQLASVRLGSVPAAIGYEPRDDFNPLPHPFP